jgi:hypothetical protein
MAESRRTPPFSGAPGRAHPLGGESPLHSRHGQVVAGGNGFSGDRESEGSRKQNAGATNLLIDLVLLYASSNAKSFTSLLDDRTERAFTDETCKPLYGGLTSLQERSSGAFSHSCRDFLARGPSSLCEGPGSAEHLPGIRK